MDWRGRQDAGEIMSYAWYEEGYGDYQGSYQEGYFGYVNEGVSQEETNCFGNQWGYNHNFEHFNNSHHYLPYESQDYSYQAQAYQQEPRFQEHEFQPWDSNYQPEEVASNQPSQDFDIKAMLQTYMESQEMGQREMEKRFKQIQSQLDQVTSTVEDLEGQLAEIESFSEVKDDSKTGDILEGEMHEEIALVVEGGEHGVLREDSEDFGSMLDESDEMVVEDCLEQEVTELPTDEESTKENLEGKAHDESWSELKAPEIKLKPLPKGLRYAFLGPNSTYPVIINDVCDDEVKWFLVELSEYRKAIGFSLDIRSISHSLCMQHTRLVDEPKSFTEDKKGLNPDLLNAFTWEDFFPLPLIDQILERLGNHALYCSLLGVLLPILCRLLWWLTLLLLALLVSTKLKLFPGNKG